MAGAQRCAVSVSGRHSALVLTWLVFTVSCLPVCQPLSIDQIICRALKHSPKDPGFMYDEKHQTVRVDLDMIYTVEDWAQLLKMNSSAEHTIHKRQAISERGGGRYWPKGIIYYEINRQEFRGRDVRILHSAMEEWMRYTCLQFQPAPPRTWNKIVFADGDGCASSVGMSRFPQEVTLSRGCRSRGVVIHELGHVLGFNHEQTRPDRDYYVKIRWENIPNHMEYNFRKYSWAVVRNLGVPYDYLSIMHYGKDAFTGNGRLTIETLDSKYQNLIGNRKGLSFRDIKSANLLYSCKPPSDRCSLQHDDCPSEGFVSKDCTCWCPTPDIYTHINRPYYVCEPLGGRNQGTGSHSGTSTDSPPGSGKGRQGGGSSDCEDGNASCQMWAERGECQNNPQYMHRSCRRACRLCDTESSCRDEYSSCAYWKRKGYCGASSLFGFFITDNCKKTCGVCKTAPGPDGGHTLPCERQCTDENEQCQAWADRGECSATSDYMLLYCKKACNACCTVVRDGGSPAKPL